MLLRSFSPLTLQNIMCFHGTLTCTCMTAVLSLEFPGILLHFVCSVTMHAPSIQCCTFRHSYDFCMLFYSIYLSIKSIKKVCQFLQCGRLYFSSSSFHVEFMFIVSVNYHVLCSYLRTLLSFSAPIFIGLDTKSLVHKQRLQCGYILLASMYLL